MWSFINTEDQSQKIYVIGLQSARLVAALFTKEQLSKWRVRSYENKPFMPMLDCAELFPSEKPRKEVRVATPASTAPAAAIATVPLAKVAPEQTNTDALRAEVLRTEALRAEDARMKSLIEVADKTEISIGSWEGSSSKESSYVFSQPVKNLDPAKVFYANSSSQEESRSFSSYKDAEHSKFSRRRNKRVDCKLRVILFFEKKVYRTYTKNVSIGGLFLDKLLPADLIGQKCKVVVGSLDNQSNLEFKAKFKENAKSGTRIVFDKEQSDDQLKLLRSWIEGVGEFSFKEQSNGFRKAV